MKRLIDYYLTTWKNDSYRMPLLLRGARQVGKTFSVRQLGKQFESFVEINLESNPLAHAIFEKNLDPARMITELSILMQHTITPGKTLLFIDEIQIVPRAITALRYFYEQMPHLHVIAAGSLLDFAIEQVGIPVGRVQSLYMYPLSFIEFLTALNEQLLIKEFFYHDHTKEISTIVHDRTLALLGDYCALGGMPRVIDIWQTTKNPVNCAKMQTTIVDAYRQDFNKYVKTAHTQYVDLIFDSIPTQLGKKFKYNAIEGEYRKRELSPALDLLITAGVAHKVFHSAGQGIPLGAQIDVQDYKVIFLDCALAQSLLNLDLAHWFINPTLEFINKGPVIEALIGQELLAYDDPYAKKNLYYWNREARGSQAEVDYLLQQENNIIPIEVKSGAGSSLRSLHLFLESHSASPYGIRFSTHNFSEYQNVKSFPLYTVALIMRQKNKELDNALNLLLSTN